MSTATERTINVSLLRVGNKPSRQALTIEIPESLTILDLDSKIPEHSGVMRVMTPEDGDKRVVWDRRDFAQIRDAKETFDKLVAQGAVPYKAGTDGKATSDVMDEFDPHAEEVIFVPIAAIAGG